MIIAGLDIGGTKCAALLANACEDSVTFLERSQIETKGTWHEILDNLCAKIKEFETRHGVKAQAVGISCGGPLSSKLGVIMSPPNLPGWDEVPVNAYVAERLGLTKELVRLKNDADACAVAEWKYGAGKGTRNMIFLTFGTGLGAGLVLNGALYSGTNDMAGEAGHIRLEKSGPTGYGKAGSFEGFCSGGGIAQLSEKYFEQKLTAKQVACLAQEGNDKALDLYREVGAALGRGLSVLIDLLNPQKIVLGGIYMRSHELMTEKMYRELEKECLPQSLAAVEILPSQLGERIGDYGAITAAVCDIGNPNAR